MSPFDILKSVVIQIFKEYGRIIAKPQAFLGLYETSTMDCFAKIFNRLYPWTVRQKALS